MLSNLKTLLIALLLINTISCNDEKRSSNEDLSKIWNNQLVCTQETFWQHAKLVNVRDSIRNEVVAIFKEVKEKNKLIEIFGIGCDTAIIMSRPTLMRTYDKEREISYDEEKSKNFKNVLVYNCGTTGSYGSYLVCFFDSNNFFIEAVVLVTS